jgi:hypothetical protein
MDREEQLRRDDEGRILEGMGIHLGPEDLEELVHQLGLASWPGIRGAERPENPLQLTGEIAGESLVRRRSFELLADG